MHHKSIKNAIFGSLKRQIIKIINHNHHVMRKTFFTLIALLLSLTTVNAQMLTPDGSITVTRQHTAVINKHMAPAMGPNRIAMDADERIMGFYDSDAIGENPLGLNTSGQFKAGVEFTKAQIGHFVGGQITKVRFALGELIGASKVSVYKVALESGELTLMSEEAVANTQKGWNDVTLATPVTIEDGVDYLICYDFTSVPGKYPLATDLGANPTGGVDGGCLMYGNLGQGGTGWYNFGTQYGNFCIQAVVKGGNFPDEDITVSSFTSTKFVQAGQNIAYSYRIKNNGNNIPSAYTIDVMLDNNVIGTTETPVALTNSPQIVNGNATIPADAVSGKHTLAVKVTKINGQAPTEYTEDDIAGMDVSVYTESMLRQKNLVEEFTSTKCPNCPLAWPVLEALTELRNDIVIMAHHDNIPQPGDPMVCDESLALSNTYNQTGDPCAMFNRYYETNTELNSAQTITLGIGYKSQYVNQAAEMLNQVIENSNSVPTFANINIKTEYNESTRELSVEVYGSGVSDFKDYLGEDAVLSVFLTEDGIKAAQTGGSRDAIHNHVTRKALSDIFGGAINWDGNTYSNKYTITLDSSWKPENMHVVAFINRPVKTNIDDVYVNNAEICKVGESITAGIEAPITDKGTGVEVERYTVDGRKISKPVKGLNIVKMSDGRTIKVIVK